LASHPFTVSRASPIQSRCAASPVVVDDAALTEIDDGRNRPAFGRSDSERRYSPLEQET
jgi:hypothetical protein